MTFWGVEIEPEEPHTHQFLFDGRRRLRLDQATLGPAIEGADDQKCVIQCNVGNKHPFYICTLLPGINESIKLNLEFEELKDVVFSISGNRNVHLVGHYVPNRKYQSENDDLSDEGLTEDEDVDDEDMDMDAEVVDRVGDDKEEDLNSLQKQHDNFEEALDVAIDALKSDYIKKFDALYKERSEIINGVNTGCDKGFWLSSMESNSLLAMEIEESDCDALNSLNNIQATRNDKGFSLVFSFDQNSYFENNDLSVELVSEDGSTLTAIHGTFIEWKEHMDLTQRVKQTAKPSLNYAPDQTHYMIIDQEKLRAEKVSVDRELKIEYEDSFFTLFDSHSPDSIPYTEIDGNQYHDTEAIEEYTYRMSRKFQIAKSFIDEIIPQSWFSEGLEAVQEKHSKLEKELYERRADIEEKYHKDCQKLYRKRCAYVNGPNKVPSFWLKAMMGDALIKQMINKRDSDALRYLKDIRWSKIGQNDFKLKFIFNPNPYFKNSTLTRIYHMASSGAKPILEGVEGTKIKWLDPKKNLTRKLVLGSMKTVVGILQKTVTRETFFDMFNAYEKVSENDPVFQVHMEREYDIWSSFYLNIIPRAFHLFSPMSSQEVVVEGKKGRLAFVYGL